MAESSTPTYTITPAIGYDVADVVLDAGTGSESHPGTVTTYTCATKPWSPGCASTTCCKPAPRFFRNAPGGPLVNHCYNNGTVFAANATCK